MSLISVLIRTTGRDSFKLALTSVLTQAYQNFEVIIVEDGSNHLESLIKQLNDDRLKYFNLLPQRGRSAAGNFAMDKASGNYLIFLDDDDLWYSNHLETLTASVAPEIIVYSLAHERGITHNNKIVSKPYLFPRDEGTLNDSNFLIINNVLFPKEAFVRLGGFVNSLDQLEDWVLWAKFAQTYEFKKVNKITSCYFVPFSLIDYCKRIAKFKRGYLEAYQLVSKFDLPKPQQTIKLYSKVWRKLKILLILFASRVVIQKNFYSSSKCINARLKE
ncbi:glycosyltransferase family 2 protein [Rickettsiales endosymbiont of Stachyamoeba lipophora]|uniref:glycosyltransferase family 2 protein n=1 Tax=Rickettsiales endosymbiont of Stachyamoeba lipophora TaxID=2486578 RepID=UPI000F646DD6|nr:glycosyltransferase family 2 protein [Rickettsiales endosymbiont of Stachyamoeba lipophora]AZL15319.1 glycosyltransferase [Rickettsiales endosymbiont of Stachyamoeba lipophora]